MNNTQYKIMLILSEDNLLILNEALTNYNGNKRIIADTMIAIIQRQVEIQKEGKKE